MYLLRVLLNALIICTLVLPTPLVAFATDITPDPSAAVGNRPSMDAASNGVPVVNIVAPTGSGLSHNMFLDFNVGTQGVIINNSNTAGISQLGGGIVGNPNFGGGAQATTILNEVTSNRPSTINGFTEIFGGKADYILANPNGVSINGGGFINTSRAVITTGQPQVAGGTLSSIEVKQGTVSVEGDGVNAAGADYFTILSRTASIAADVHGNHVAVTAGRNSYDPATGTATPLPEDAASPAPTVGIDSSALGGMYANRIVLIANEKGVGVNLQGAVNAGSMTLNADGKLTFKQIQTDTATDITAGTVEIAGGSTLISKGDITVTAGTINNTGLTYSGGKTTLLADTTLTNKAGSIVSKGDLTLGDAQTTSPGTVDVTITNEGGLVQSQEGDVDITAHAFLNKMEMLSIQRVVLQSYNNGPTSVFAPGCYEKTVSSSGYEFEDRLVAKSPTPQVMAGGNLAIDAHTLTNDNGLLVAKIDMSLNGDILENRGTKLYRVAHSETHVDTIPDIHSDMGQPISHSTISDTSTLLSTVPATIAAGGTLDLNFTSEINNDIIQRTTDYEGLAASPDGASGRVDLGVAGIGSLFTAAPETTLYVYVTNPGITSLGDLYGSDYFLSRMGWDLEEHHQKLLGDAFFETQLVRRQIAELNARSVAASIDQPDADVMLNLMDNAVAEGEALHLSVGIELTKEQVDALSKDIIWLVEEEYDGQTVLVPKVYLAKASRSTVAANGVGIAANDIRLKTTNLVNKGSISGSTVQLSADEVQNLGGMLEGTSALVVDASGTILNRSGSIKGGDVSLTAGDDIVSVTTTHMTALRDGYRQDMNQAAAIAATGTLNMQAGNDIRVKAGIVSAGGDATIAAGNDVEFGAVAHSEARKLGKWSMQAVRQEGSTVSSGGNLQVTAGRDVNVLGSTVSSAGDMAVTAGEHVNIASVQETYHSESKKKKSGGLFGGGGSTNISEDYTLRKSSEISSGGDIRIEAGAKGFGDALIAASNVKSEGGIDIVAEGNVVIASQSTSSHVNSESSSKGLLTSKSKLDDVNKVSVVRSTLEAKDSISILSKNKDITITASSLTSGADIKLEAQQGRIAILTEKETLSEHHSTSDMGFVTWTATDKGKYAETVVHSLLDAKGNITFTAADGVVIEYRQTGNVQQDIEQLAKAPGLEWMGELLERDDVDWQGVQEVYDDWSHTSGGLGTGAMIVIAIAASAITAGAASSLALAATGLHTVATASGTMLVTSTGVAASSMQIAMYTALTAGFTAIGSNVAVSVADAAAGGDLEKNLAGIVSEDGLRSIVTSMVLAGTLSTVSSDIAKLDDLSAIMAETVVRTTVQTTVGGEELNTAFITALGSTFGGYLRGEISEADLNKAIELVVSGAAGATGAAIVGGDPMQGAFAAIIAEIADDITAAPLTEEQKKEHGPLARLSNGDYEDDFKGSGDYVRMSNQDLIDHGFNPDLLNNDKIGFTAQLFMNTETRELAVAFRGSDQIKDFIDGNIPQGLGVVGKQYMELAGYVTALDQLKVNMGAASITATGHSLGGGLAQALASTGVVNKVVVFNSAGVHKNTLAALNPGKNVDDVAAKMHSVTTSYSSRADILTNIQDLFSFLFPQTGGKRVLVDGAGVHGINGIVEAFNIP